MRKPRASFIGLAALLAAILFLSAPPGYAAQPDHDHILSRLQHGGPGKDGIPAIDDPGFTSADRADLEDGDLVFGIMLDGRALAFPEQYMVWHEIVNMESAGGKLSVTYCPLTASAVGYEGYNLGVSGKLYNSNLVMYDRATDGLIPQIMGEFISGPRQGERPATFPVIRATWGDWLRTHPDTEVLAVTPGFRPYGRDPYDGYEDTERVFFPVEAESSALPAKELVLGVETGGETAAVPLSGFADRHRNGLEMELGGRTVRLVHDPELETVTAEDPGLKHFPVYWFAWYAFHPDTRVGE
jgi:hypothetical protein